MGQVRVEVQRVDAVGDQAWVGQALAAGRLARDVGLESESRRVDRLDAGAVDGQTVAGDAPLGVGARDDQRAVALGDLHDPAQVGDGAAVVGRGRDRDVVPVDEQGDLCAPLLGHGCRFLSAVRGGLGLPIGDADGRQRTPAAMAGTRRASLRRGGRGTDALLLGTVMLQRSMRR